MAQTTQYIIGTEARCSDGVCGEVIRVVVDPVAQAVTHLVVEPKHRHGLGRLVPLDLAEVTTGGIQLRCTRAEFENLGLAEETQLIQGSGNFAGYGSGQVGYWPYYGLSGGIRLGGGLGLGGGAGMNPGMRDGPHTVIQDTVPLGEVEVRRGEHVHATDGDIGLVQGLVIDPGSRHVEGPG